MRRPKHKSWRAHGSDCHRNRYTSHGDANVVTLTVTEHETTGKLIIELHDLQGEVTLMGPNGLVFDLTRTAAQQKQCACHRGQHCDVSHDPASCPCTQCRAATKKALARAEELTHG